MSKRKVVDFGIDRKKEVRQYLLDRALKGRLSLITPEVRKEIQSVARATAISEVIDNVAELLYKKAEDTLWITQHQTFWDAFEDMIRAKYKTEPIGWTEYSRRFDKKFGKVKP